MSKPHRSPSSQSHIGVRTQYYQDESRNRPVAVEIWYPTRQEGPFDDPEDFIWLHPKEVRNATLPEMKFPLIVMSHGHRGDRRDRSWLVESLVKSGFVVASVEHYGNSWKSYNPLLSLRFWERAVDVTFAISELLKDPSLKGIVDSERIGFVGYSLGGMTGLALGGARAGDVKEIILRERESFKDIDLDLVEKIDFSEAKRNFLDPRIKAFVLLSPAAFIFPPETFKEIKAPVALVASQGDEVLPFKEHALKVIESLTPTRLKLLRDPASHYVFLNRVSEQGKRLIWKEIQTESIEADRLVVHREVADFVSSFFRDHLP